MTYLDIMIRMRQKKYFVRSLWGMLELCIVILLSLIVVNFVLRFFNKRISIADIIFGIVPDLVAVFLLSSSILFIFPKIAKHTQRFESRNGDKDRRF